MSHLIHQYAGVHKPLIRIAIEDMTDEEFLDWYNYLMHRDSLGTTEDWRRVRERYMSICAPGVAS